jgi:hypothetical protein
VIENLLFHSKIYGEELETKQAILQCIQLTDLRTTRDSQTPGTIDWTVRLRVRLIGL